MGGFSELDATGSRITPGSRARRGGHDVWHAIRVAQIAHLIVKSDYPEYARLAAIAGLCHNADHIVTRGSLFEDEGDQRLATMALIRRWLKESCECELIESQELVVDAVMGHTGPNCDTDSMVKIGLMDADRLVNLELDLVMRAGQYRPEIPAVDFRHWLYDPEATYKEPRSVTRNLLSSVEWMDRPGVHLFTIRLSTARAMGRRHVEALRMFLSTLKRQCRDVGLEPGQINPDLMELLG